MPTERHSLLRRQLRSCFGEREPDAETLSFIGAVDEAYRQSDEDRRMVERSLDLSSEELFESNTELRGLINALPDLVLRVAPDGRVDDVKGGYEEDLYQGAQGLLGTLLQDAAAPAGAELKAEIDQALAEGDRRTFEYEVDQRDGKRFREARILPIGQHALVVIRDVTDRKRALEELTGAKADLERRVMERTEELREANLALKREMDERAQAEERRRRLEGKMMQTQKLESLGVLAGGIAHDFNNLLMAILGNAALAHEALPPDSDAHRNLQEIEAASQRAAGLTNQMLSYSGKRSLVSEQIDVSAVTESMSDLLKVSVSKKAELAFDLGFRLPLVEADTTQVGQVVMNLITNASEALGPNGGMVMVRTYERQVDAEFLAECAFGADAEPGHFVVIEVRDDGEGMDEETRTKVFDPFFTTKFTGRGLGLPSVVGIVRGHRGALALTSVPGRGTCFTVLLPATAHSAVDESASGASTDARATILVVDDDAAVRRLIRTALESSGYRTVTAEDGREGVNVFQRQRDQIACVALDVTMPVMDGEEAFTKIREICAEVPVIFMSGFAMADVRGRFGDGTPVDFLQKPFLPQDLVGRVDNMVELAGKG